MKNYYIKFSDKGKNDETLLGLLDIGNESNNDKTNNFPWNTYLEINFLKSMQFMETEIDLRYNFYLENKEKDIQYTCLWGALSFLDLIKVKSKN